MKGKAWLLLVINLPGKNQTLRMRIWRSVKSSGAASLRDGVYLLPDTPTGREFFNQQGQDVHNGKGTVHIFPFTAESPQRHQQLMKLFDRTPDYAALHRLVEKMNVASKKVKEPDLRRQLAALRRSASELAAVDYFPGEARAQVDRALAAAELAINARFSSDEPRAAHGKIVRQDRKKFAQRIWATREHLWIDRVCSAWLIRRFIDPKANFLWLKTTKDCPKRAVGFDFDGATFTHTDNKVTFEVLLESFALTQDVALTRIGALVHYLDVGGIPVEEAAGLSTIIAGARALTEHDDALLKSVSPILDNLYASYASRKKN